MLIRSNSQTAFSNTVKGHGWYQLAPFEFDEEAGALRFAVDLGNQVFDVSVVGNKESLQVTCVPDGRVSEVTVNAVVRRILRLDEPFEEFHGSVVTDDDYSWIQHRGFGPLLRSPTVFEDLVKTICTTNCSWSLTKAMVANLVGQLGAAAPSGRRAFPSPESIAGKSEGFFRDEIRAGYRGPYILELASAVAEGRIDPEGWEESGLSSDELKKEIKKIKGVGDYAAEHMLKLLGRYDGLALDSFLRSEFYKSYNRGKECPDKSINKHYSRFGPWKGLVIWFDMVEKRAASGNK